MSKNIDLDKLLFDNLANVNKPGRYIGREINSVSKDFNKQDVKFALCFPDTYEVGMSHLGFKIIYQILNSIDGVVCERFFSPWGDFEEFLKKHSLEIFSLESRRPLKEFDIIGFSIAHELNYTNALNILKLGNVNLRANERTKNEPLIIAGGYSCFNPEPLSDFIDAFVIGEAEEVLFEIIETYKDARSNKDKLLNNLASLNGIYVPSLYEEKLGPGDGSFKGLVPRKDNLPLKICKRYLSDFNSAYYPTDQIVPYINIIHDRISIEIMRGCARRCRFCQASSVTRPVRFRNPDKVLELAKDTYRMTGYEEISLVSLSSIDHPDIKDIILRLNEYFSSKGISVSLPSLRVEKALRNVPSLISQTKKTGLTFAPEAGTERLRKVLSKNIDIDNLFTACQEAFEAGWRHLKLYFMIGLPTETEEDLKGIAKMSRDLSRLRIKVDGHPSTINASLASFIPKAHTSFQWNAMEDIGVLKEKANLLKSMLRKGVYKVNVHNIESSFIEAVFSRGDRKLSKVLLSAFENGCKFDNWKDSFKFNTWIDAFSKTGTDPYEYTKKRDFEDTMAWDMIDIGIDKDSLVKENMLAMGQGVNLHT